MEIKWREYLDGKISVIQYGTVVIGSGCAGLNAIDWLYELGLKDSVLISEDLNAGTSRNTGSDKQTYYKLSLSGNANDSVEALAKTLFCEGVNGDNALQEAACSTQCFFKLVSLQVPFPCNEYGEYAGYQTDHDTFTRATSAGPLTSKYMTEALEKNAFSKNINFIDKCLAFKVIKDENGVVGVLTYNKTNKSIQLILCRNVIVATGGPACVYKDSVYPLGHTGMSGMMLDAGAEGMNLHQWQYGLASVKFRWNVSGSYQQVLPRYISVDNIGNESEFLSKYFEDPKKAVYMCFLKGYQWPFDSGRIEGSSLIDIAVWHETCILGNRVYMDYTRNPSCIEKSLNGLEKEVLDYLVQSKAVQDTPYKRLLQLNEPAIKLYKNHGIDIQKEPLEIRVCSQHHNGGIAVDEHWETKVKGLFVVGEAAGTFGTYRPGGSALNTTQVSSMQAAKYIAGKSIQSNISIDRAIDILENDKPSLFNSNVLKHQEIYQAYMSTYGAFFRDIHKLEEYKEKLKQELQSKTEPLVLNETLCIEKRIKLRDLMITQLAVCSAMIEAAKKCGSCGSALVKSDNGKKINSNLDYRIAENIQLKRNMAVYTKSEDGINWVSKFIDVRLIPNRDLWFETVWKKYRERK